MKRFLFETTTLYRAPDGEGAGAAATTGAAAGAGESGAAAAGASTAGAATGAAAAGDGTAAAAVAPDWTSTLTEDHRQFVTTKGYKTPADLITAYHNAEKVIGLDKVAIPKDDSPKEVKDAFFAKIGRPPEAAAYELKAPDGIPDYKPEMSAAYAGVAFDLGLTKAQANGMHDWFMGLAKQGLAAEAGAGEAKANESWQALQTEWGLKAPVNVENANRAIAHYGGDDAIAYLKQRGLHHDPVLNKIMAKVGAAMAGDSIAGAGGGNSSFAKTPQEALAEIARMDGDPKGPLFDKYHPEHKLAVQKRADLFAQAYPERKAS